MKTNFNLTILANIIFLSSQFVFAQKTIDTYKVESEGYFTHPVNTTAGVVATDNFASKIYLIQNFKLKELISSPGCGRYFTVSPDKSKIGFKQITPDGMQVPAVFDLQTMKITKLSNPVNLCGQVSFSNNGKIAFTVGNELFIKDGVNFTSFNLGTYSNIAPISPDGNFVIFNNNSDQLFIICLTSGQVKQITDNTGGYCYPEWSPDGNKIVFSTLSGILMVLDKTTNITYTVGKGENASWSDDSQFIFYNVVSNENLEYKGSEIYVSKYDGSAIKQLTNTSDINEMFP
ncbi:MAG: hypothetical protein HGB12_10515, partial [Bacteroidetes bacterium]|nr:hypothetical protein [Bacteroidota bacterium]